MTFKNRNHKETTRKAINQKLKRFLQQGDTVISIAVNNRRLLKEVHLNFCTSMSIVEQGVEKNPDLETQLH